MSASDDDCDFDTTGEITATAAIATAAKNTDAGTHDDNSSTAVIDDDAMAAVMAVTDRTRKLSHHKAKKSKKSAPTPSKQHELKKIVSQNQLFYEQFYIKFGVEKGPLYYSFIELLEVPWHTQTLSTYMCVYLCMYLCMYACIYL